ncbi:hypothetical protein CsatB_009394 [Cannabis sativa]
MAFFFDSARHWVTLEVDLDHWLLNIFDSSLGSISPNELKSHLVKWEKILPTLMLQASLFESHDMILLPQLTASESRLEVLLQKSSTGALFDRRNQAVTARCM